MCMHMHPCMIVCVCVGGGFRVKEVFYQQAPAAVAALSS